MSLELKSKACGKTPVLGGDRLDPRQQKSHRERQVEEHMGKQDAAQPEDSWKLRQPHLQKRLVDEALPSIDRDDSENGDELRQSEGNGKETQKELPTWKMLPSCQRPRDRNGKAGREQGR